MTSASSVPIQGSTPAAWTQTFQYDGFGNLTGKTLNGVTTAIATDPATHRLVNAAYDANGNMTSGGGVGMSYDEANRVSVAGAYSGGVEYYGYSPDNKAVYRLDSLGRDHWTLWGERGEKLRVYQEGWAGVYFAGKLINRDPYEIQYSRGGQMTDRLGANRAGGARFYPYGEQIGTSTATDGAQFASYTRSGFSGLDYAQNRYYASSLGRFSSPDPYQATAQGTNDPSAPQSWNRYAYVTGDPVNMFDPGGTCGTPSIFGNGPGTGGEAVFRQSVSIPCDGGTLGNNGKALPSVTGTHADGEQFSSPTGSCPDLPLLPSDIPTDQVLKNVEEAHSFYNTVLDSNPESAITSLLGFFVGKFSEGGAWDYKKDYVNGTVAHEAARVFGNFNFGAVLESFDFSYSVTQNAAGIAQIAICLKTGTCGTGIPFIRFPFGDQVTDAGDIRRGYVFDQKLRSGCR